jgi:hypothetical protein
MKNRIIIGLLAACIGVWIYLASTKQAASVAVAVQEAASAPATPPASAAPPAPVVLAEVVEVIDIDPLLDPPARPMAGVPFDAEPESAPISAPAAPARIPPAVD